VSDVPVTRGPDGLTRCSWAGDSPDYIAYHDLEWGRPVTDDTRLFEKVCLEGFQSGLSWLTILRKRENFRSAFAGFDPAAVARFDHHDVERLMNDAGIIRHRGKITAAVNNASRALEVIDEFGSLAAYFWSWEPERCPPNREPDPQEWAPTATTTESVALARDLKRRGWRFVGPTTAYAFMQAMGLVNDHAPGCHVRSVVDDLRAGLDRPGRP